MFLLLLFGFSGAHELQRQLFGEQHFSQEIEFPRFNFTGISVQCTKDMETWQRSVLLFAEEFNSCFLNNSLSGSCSDEEKEKMKKNLYGLKQLDAFGRIPPGLLDIKTIAYGDLQECQEVSRNFYYETNYCFVHSEINTGANAACQNKNLAVFSSAICMPRSCTEEDILNLASQHQRLGILNQCYVSCKKTEGATNAFTWVFLGIMSLLTGLLLVGSVLDYILENFYKTSNEQVENSVFKVLLAFSIYTNGSLVWNTTPPREGHIRCLDCMRFLSMVWVAAGHILNFNIANDAIVPLLRIPRPILVDTLMSSFFSVDTFFVLSGLLVSYLFFKTLFKTGSKMMKNPLTWVLFYVHRYLRLTPPYMLFICFFMVVTPLMTGIPVTEWNYEEKIIKPCRDNWWRNLLYIQNLDSNQEECYSIAWYMAVDMQLYIVAPIFLLAFFFSAWLGLGAVCLACLGSSAATIALTIHYDLPATATRFKNVDKFNDYIYEKPWIRCPPYLIGMAAGYFLAKYGNKRPKIHWALPLIGWVLAVAMALAILWGPHDYLAMETNWTRGIRGLYDAGSRVGWALVIVWVVFANHFGYGGLAAKFMEYPIWQPFGRLSYCAYLCHMFLIYYLWNLQDRPPHFDGVWSQFIQKTIPVVVMAYFFAFFWSCLTEIPFLKLEKQLFDWIMPNRRVKVEISEDKMPEEAWNEE